MLLRILSSGVPIIVPKTTKAARSMGYTKNMLGHITTLYVSASIPPIG